MSHMNDSVIFFYNQPDYLKKKGKRPKKNLGENVIKNLNKKIGDKYQSDLMNKNGTDQSLAARLAELAANNSVVSMNSSNNLSRSNRRGAIFTDTRLQALRFLTEDMIKELEEQLIHYAENEIKPSLTGQIIYDLHSDWSDLTDKCHYTSFPLWQTKNGRDSLSKKSPENKKEENSSQVNQSETSTDNRKESQSSLGQKKNVKINRQSSKLASISEKSVERTSRNQSTSRRSSSSAKVTSPSSNQKSRTEVMSRLTHNHSTNNGCLLNYQLSNKLDREKGWTVLKIDLDEELLDNGRRISNCLKQSLGNIEEVRTYNNRNGLVKQCKIRFYGDRKKEQLEKYKNTLIRPKKSLFAMSISRNEIPKPLDVNYMLEIMSNPNLVGMSLSNSLTSSKSSLAQSSTSVKQLSSIQFPKPPCLLNTQTNDGTTCVYYKNGQLAILIANVFGYYLENVGGNSNTDSRGTVQNIQASINSSFSGSNNANNPTLCWQNIRNSNTTVIYDMFKKVPKSASSGAVSTRLDTITSTDDYDDNFKKVFENTPKGTEPRLLALISPLGYCVVYRPNGNPRFVCTEYGGCLCNINGSVSYQWKWDDVRYADYERFKNELFIDLNECIRLEYKNPNNIKLKFKCDKEVMDFDLSCSKENNNKLHDLLNRVASDLPMKSKFSSQFKIVQSSRPPGILNYKQHHQQQQQNNQIHIKASIYLGQNKEQEKAKIDKLLEKTVSYKDVPLMKDLLVIQKKIRSILEDWLLYTRNSLGILEPDLYILPDFPLNQKANRFNENHADFDKIVLLRRKSKSAENLYSKSRYDFESEISGRTKYLKKAIMLNKSVDLFDDDKRSKSAFISRKYGMNLKNQNEFMVKLKDFRSGNQELFLLNSKKTDNKISKHLSNYCKSAIWSSNELNKAKIMSSSRVLLNALPGSKNAFSLDLESLANLTSKSNRLFTNDDLNLMCPVSLHQKLAFDKYDVDCKCKKISVPVINDVEFDYFLRLVPIEQMIAIAIIDSELPSTYLQLMFMNLHEKNNKIRIQPCKESLRDECRFFFYDIRIATEDSDHTQPLLVTRHNVVPGMVLIYKNSKLLFCDNIFNGYGYSQQDFLKQLDQCKEDAKQEKYLPYNFHFNHPFGKAGRRTAWGGQIVADEEDKYYDSYEDMSEITKKISNNLVPKLMVKREKSNINLPKINKSSVQV